jgi:hypothetical protein
MIKVEQKVNENGFTLKGNMPDILTFLEREQERCGKIPVLQYIKQRKAEDLSVSKLVNPSYKAGN